MSNLVKINNVEHLTAMIKAIVPRSFEKTFGGLSTSEIVAGFTFCVAGFSQSELNTGLAKIKQMGYCPDPALFAKWCRGIDGFDNCDAVADSYIGKHGALAQIIKWQNDPATLITVAMKTAYDETYELWSSINSSSDVMRAELAFRDFYEQIVHELVKARTPCQVYVPPTALNEPTAKKREVLNCDEAIQFLQKIKEGLVIT